MVLQILQVFIEPFNFSFFSLSGWGIDLDYCDIEWFALEMNRDHSVIFESASKYRISYSFVDYDGYSISSKGFLPKVVDIYGGGCDLVSKLCPTLVAPGTAACQFPLPVRFCRQEFWSGLPFPSLGYLPDPGIKPMSPALQAHFSSTELRGKPRCNGYQS